MVGVADRPDQLRTKQEPLQQRASTNVQVAVAQSQALVDRSVRLVDVERRRLGLAKDFNLTAPNLDLAGEQLLVLLAGHSPGDLALDRQHELVAGPVGDGVSGRRLLGVHHDLRHAVAIAQIQEDEMAVVAAAMHPAGHADGAARVVGSQLAAGHVAVRRGEAEGRFGRRRAGLTHAEHRIRTRAHPTGNRMT